MLLYSSIYDDVPNVVNIAGRFDLQRGITERFGGDIIARLAAEKQLVLTQVCPLVQLVPDLIRADARPPAFSQRKHLITKHQSTLHQRHSSTDSSGLQTRDDGHTFDWTLTKWSLQDRLDTDMAAAARKIRLAEVLTLHGSADRVIPVEDAYQWGGLITHHELKLVAGGDHNFLAAEHADAVVAAVVERCTL